MILQERTLAVVSLPDLNDPSVIIVGYAGRDLAAVQHHIDELAAIGVAPPPHVPMLYPVEPSTLENTELMTVVGSNTSGEIEPVLVRARGNWYLTLGSDHTDRDVETRDILLSKQVCGKPIGATAISLPNVDKADALWDTATAHSWVDNVPYQSGTLASLRLPSDIIARVDQTREDGDLVIFCGTFPLLDGVFRPGGEFRASLTVPGLQPLVLTYNTLILDATTEGATS